MLDTWPTAGGGAAQNSSSRLAETALARLAMTLGRPLGGLPAQPVLDLMMTFLRRRHPGLFERLDELGETDVLIDPVDMPACLHIGLGASPRLRLVDRGAQPAAATVRGTFAVLLDLAEGRIDGDALFFSRDLAIEGDTEIVVALRNAVDAEELNLEAEVQVALGPLGRFVPPARQHLTRLVERLERVRLSIIGAVPARAPERL